MNLVRQRRPFDCGVAAVAMFCRAPYEDVYAAAVQRRGAKIREGLWMRDIRLLALRFGRALTPTHRRRVDLEEDAGVLSVLWNDRPRWADSHVVVLRRGTVIDPADASVWDAEEYLTSRGCRVGSLLKE